LLGGRTVIHSNYSGYEFMVDVTPIVFIVMFAASLNFVHDLLEYIAYKRGEDVYEDPVELEDGVACTALIVTEGLVQKAEDPAD
jgi:hypothetical protein